MELLDCAQLCYNLRMSSVAKKSPFELVLGVQPNTPLYLAKSKSQGNYHVAYKYAWDKQEMLDEVQDSFRKAAKRMKKYVDQH